MDSSSSSGKTTGRKGRRLKWAGLNLLSGTKDKDRSDSHMEAGNQHHWGTALPRVPLPASVSKETLVSFLYDNLCYYTVIYTWRLEVISFKLLSLLVEAKSSFVMVVSNYLIIFCELQCQLLEKKLVDSQLFFEFENIPKKKQNAELSSANHPDNSTRNR